MKQFNVSKEHLSKSTLISFFLLNGETVINISVLIEDFVDIKTSGSEYRFSSSFSLVCCKLVVTD